MPVVVCDDVDEVHVRDLLLPKPEAVRLSGWWVVGGGVKPLSDREGQSSASAKIRDVSRSRGRRPLRRRTRHEIRLRAFLRRGVSRGGGGLLSSS